MKEKFLSPQMEIVELEATDTIATSNFDAEGRFNDSGEWEEIGD